MSHLSRRHPRVPESPPIQESERFDEPARSPFSQVAVRFASWVAGADRVVPEDEYDEYESEYEPSQALLAAAETRREPVADEMTRFPLARYGYDRAAVDAQLIELEGEIARLRAQGGRSPMSITEELERIGEQTASILVVAHDKAQETTRRAQEQADRCVADAAANAVEITAKARQRLRQLDSETDSVWRERERLLDDIRVVSLALATLADDASGRFPAAEMSASRDGSDDRGDGGDGTPTALAARVAIDQPTVAFSVLHDDEPAADARPGAEELAAPSRPEPAATGDTGSWLAGLRPE